GRRSRLREPAAIAIAFRATAGSSGSLIRRGPEGAAQVLRQSAARCQLAAALAKISEAQNRIDQVVVGGELERVDSRNAKRRAQFGLALRRRGREAFAKTLVVRIDEQLLTGLGVLD